MANDERQETVGDIVAEIGEMSDWCHNNIGSKTWEDWEKMHEWLLDIRRRFETAVLRKAIELSKRFVPGNAAAMREACANIAEYARSARCHTEDAHVLYFIYGIEGWARSALSAPARNCDLYKTAREAEKAFDDFCLESLHGKCKPGDCNLPRNTGAGSCLLAWLFALAAEKGAGDGSK